MNILNPKKYKCDLDTKNFLVYSQKHLICENWDFLSHTWIKAAGTISLFFRRPFQKKNNKLLLNFFEWWTTMFLRKNRTNCWIIQFRKSQLEKFWKHDHFSGIQLPKNRFDGLWSSQRPGASVRVRYLSWLNDDFYLQVQILGMF